MWMIVLMRFEEAHMLKKFRCISLLLLWAFLAGVGCKDKNVDRSQGAGTPDPAAVKAYFDAVSKGMKTIPVDRISATMVGKGCAIMAATPQDRLPPPPPLGMMHIMGPTTVYQGTCAEVGADAVTVEVAYPASGKSKKIVVPVPDIQMIAVEN